MPRFIGQIHGSPPPEIDSLLKCATKNKQYPLKYRESIFYAHSVYPALSCDDLTIIND